MLRLLWAAGCRSGELLDVLAAFKLPPNGLIMPSLSDEELGENVCCGQCRYSPVGRWGGLDEAGFFAKLERV